MVKVVSAGFAAVNSLFSLENYSLFGGRHWDCTHPVSAQSFTRHFSIHWWVLSVAIATVVFTSLVPSAFITCDSSIRKSGIFFLFVCSCVDSRVYIVFFGSEFSATVIYLFAQPLPTWAIGSFPGWTPTPLWYALILSFSFLPLFPFFWRWASPPPTHECNLWLHMGLESNPGLSEDGPRASGGQGYLLLQNAPT